MLFNGTQIFVSSFIPSHFPLKLAWKLRSRDVLASYNTPTGHRMRRMNTWSDRGSPDVDLIAQFSGSI